MGRILELVKALSRYSPHSGSRSNVTPRCSTRCSTRWSTTLPSKVSFPHAIDCRALCGAKLVTVPQNYWGTDPSYYTVWSLQIAGTWLTPDTGADTRSDRRSNASFKGCVCGMLTEAPFPRWAPRRRLNESIWVDNPIPAVRITQWYCRQLKRGDSFMRNSPPP